MRRKTKIRNNRQSKYGMFLVSTVVLILLVVVSIKSVELRETRQQYHEKEERLLVQIQEQEDRAKELEEFKKYTQTKAFAEEMAKDNLGLVKEGEIIFKAE